jgi:hypothetical protein
VVYRALKAQALALERKKKPEPSEIAALWEALHALEAEPTIGAQSQQEDHAAE